MREFIAAIYSTLYYFLELSPSWNISQRYPEYYPWITGPGLRNYIPARPFQYCTGQGGTLEEAEQDAARKALQSIRASDSEVARVFVRKKGWRWLVGFVGMDLEV